MIDEIGPSCAPVTLVVEHEVKSHLESLRYVVGATVRVVDVSNDVELEG